MYIHGTCLMFSFLLFVKNWNQMLRKQKDCRRLPLLHINDDDDDRIVTKKIYVLRKSNKVSNT